jgi:aldehyde:ferredoxin oxidoreductase
VRRKLRMNRVVRVDMGTKSVKTELRDEYRYYGGRELVVRITSAEVSANCEPLGRKNKLILAPGLLAGTPASSASRISIGGKSPLTNGIKEANCGGTAGAQFAHRGIKAIVLEGRSEDSECWILKVDKDGVKIEADNDMRFLGTYDTVSSLKKKYGEKVGVICIGPAGERGLRAASVAISDPTGELKFAARGGMGAVMGVKGLKANVVDDSAAEPIAYHDKAAFSQYARSLNKQLSGNPKTKDIYHRFGTSAIVKAVNAMGALPVRNFSRGSSEFVDQLCGEKLNETITSRGGEGKLAIPCMKGCVIRCSHAYPDEDGSKIVSTLQYETIALVGSNLDFDNLDSVARLNREINDLGLDSIETGATLGIALEEGLGKFGNEEDCMALLQEIRNNTVLGRVLGNGALITGQVLGSLRIPVAKGQAFAGYDPRALKGNGVTYAMSPQGADHTAGNCFGARNEVDPLSTEKQGELSKGTQRKMTTLDSLGFCIFARVPLFADPSLLAGLVNALTGSDFTDETIWSIGEDTVRLEREFNIKAGISPAQDILPEYVRHERLEPTDSVFDLSVEEMEKAIL